MKQIVCVVLFATANGGKLPRSYVDLQGAGNDFNYGGPTGGGHYGGGDSYESKGASEEGGEFRGGEIQDGGEKWATNPEVIRHPKEATSYQRYNLLSYGVKHETPKKAVGFGIAGDGQDKEKWLTTSQLESGGGLGGLVQIEGENKGWRNVGSGVEDNKVQKGWIQVPQDVVENATIPLVGHRFVFRVKDESERKLRKENGGLRWRNVSSAGGNGHQGSEGGLTNVVTLHKGWNQQVIGTTKPTSLNVVQGVELWGRPTSVSGGGEKEWSLKAGGVLQGQNTLSGSTGSYAGPVSVVGGSTFVGTSHTGWNQIGTTKPTSSKSVELWGRPTSGSGEGGVKEWSQQVQGQNTMSGTGRSNSGPVSVLGGLTHVWEYTKEGEDVKKGSLEGIDNVRNEQGSRKEIGWTNQGWDQQDKSFVMQNIGQYELDDEIKVWDHHSKVLEGEKGESGRLAKGWKSQGNSNKYATSFSNVVRLEKPGSELTAGGDGSSEDSRKGWGGQVSNHQQQHTEVLTNQDNVWQSQGVTSETPKGGSNKVFESSAGSSGWWDSGKGVPKAPQNGQSHEVWNVQQGGGPQSSGQSHEVWNVQQGGVPQGGQSHESWNVQQVEVPEGGGQSDEVWNVQQGGVPQGGQSDEVWNVQKGGVPQGGQSDKVWNVQQGHAGATIRGSNLGWENQANGQVEVGRTNTFNSGSVPTNVWASPSRGNGGGTGRIPAKVWQQQTGGSGKPSSSGNGMVVQGYETTVQIGNGGGTKGWKDEVNSSGGLGGDVIGSGNGWRHEGVPQGTTKQLNGHEWGGSLGFEDAKDESWQHLVGGLEVAKGKPQVFEGEWKDLQGGSQRPQEAVQGHDKWFVGREWSATPSQINGHQGSSFQGVKGSPEGVEGSTTDWQQQVGEQNGLADQVAWSQGGTRLVKVTEDQNRGRENEGKGVQEQLGGYGGSNVEWGIPTGGSSGAVKGGENQDVGGASFVGDLEFVGGQGGVASQGRGNEVIGRITNNSGGTTGGWVTTSGSSTPPGKETPGVDGGFGGSIGWENLELVLNGGQRGNGESKVGGLVESGWLRLRDSKSPQGGGAVENGGTSRGYPYSLGNHVGDSKVALSASRGESGRVKEGSYPSYDFSSGNYYGNSDGSLKYMQWGESGVNMGGKGEGSTGNTNIFGHYGGNAKWASEMQGDGTGVNGGKFENYAGSYETSRGYRAGDLETQESVGKSSGRFRQNLGKPGST